MQARTNPQKADLARRRPGTGLRSIYARVRIPAKAKAAAKQATMVAKVRTVVRAKVAAQLCIGCVFTDLLPDHKN
jgi:hypothetical protein